MAIACISHAYTTRADAAVEKRQVERLLRTSIRIKYCEGCDAFHHESASIDPDRRLYLNERDITILMRLALGLEGTEIARELGVSKFVVSRRLVKMQRRFGATNLPNLIATVIFLRIISVDDLIPKVKEDHVASNPN